MSYTLNYTGSEIDDILDRAAPGGAIDQAIAAKQDALTFDAVPTEGSTNPAESGGIYDAIQAGGAAALAAFATDSVSGDVVSITDGADGIPAKSFVGSIIPQQNLNGQSAPYPAGGGKNKLNPANTTVGKSISNAGAIVTNANCAIASEFIPIGSNTSVALSAKTAVAMYIACYDNNQDFISRIDAASTTSHVFTLAANTVYVKWMINYGAVVTQTIIDGLNLQLEMGSTATAYAPYANICPISGWTGANITRTGKNLFGGEPLGDAIYAHATGSIDKTAKTVTFTHGDGSKLDFKVKWQPNTQYTFLFTIASYSGQNTSMRVWYTDGTKASISFNNLSVNSVVRFVTSAGKTVEGVYLEWFATGSVGIYYEKSGVFEGSVNATDLEPYTADTILLDFGQTVYAGTLTALGGGLWKIQPTHAIVDLGSAEWTYDATYTRFKTTVSAANYGNRLMPIYCSIYQCIDDGRALANVPDYSIYNGSSTSIYIKDTRYTDPAAIALALSGQYMVYPLGTLPDPITITGEDLQTLLGANTVWTDVGAVTELTYRADTALYIQKLLNGGALQTLSMASPSPSLSLGRVDVLAEPEVAEPEQAEEVGEQPEESEEE